MNQGEVLDFLKANSDKNYDAFNSRLVRTNASTLGVRVPVLRKFASQIAKDCSVEFLKEQKPRYFEEFSLRGFVIGSLRGDTEMILEEVEKFVPMIDNWATCDTFCSSLKYLVKKEPQKVWNMIEHNLKSEKEFEVRWGLIMMLSHYLNQEYIDRVLVHLQQAKSSDYYIEMGVAWTLATALAKFRDKAMAVYTNGDLSDGARKKAIRKACESFRIRVEDKEYLKKLIKR